MTRFSLKSRLSSSKEPAFGTWISSSSLVCLDALKEMEFQWFMIDTEHAHVNPETMAAMVSSLGDNGPAPLVRVGNIDQYLIKQALDSAAEGILVPLVSTAAQAKAVVSFAKYPPLGVRGIAAAASTRYGLNLPEYLRTANSDTLVGVQIETKEAMANLDSIAAVEGLDLLFVGPQDLTLNLGLGHDRSNPKVKEAMQEVVKACEKHGKLPGTLVINPEEKRSAVELGFRFISLASDIRFLIQGAKYYLDS